MEMERTDSYRSHQKLKHTNTENMQGCTNERRPGPPAPPFVPATHSIQPPVQTKAMPLHSNRSPKKHEVIYKPRYR